MPAFGAPISRATVPAGGLRSSLRHSHRIGRMPSEPKVHSRAERARSRCDPLPNGILGACGNRGDGQEA
jgi:hypothetical protein